MMEKQSARRIPDSLQEAYRLRDGSETQEEREFYQEHVYRLRAREYRMRGIITERSVRRRELDRAKTCRILEARARPWWRRVLFR